MTSLLDARRPACATCLRPQKACICHWITPIEHTVEVLVLQHPQEAGNAKGSARLLHLSLSRSRLAVGEIFPEQELNALLHAPFDRRQTSGAPAHRKPGGQTILLYPDASGDATGAGTIATPPLPGSSASHVGLYAPANLRLVVLDGTWRESRKMFSLNPLLQTLPRLALRNLPASQYRIRKAHRADQRSTLEATCYALMQLEENIEKYQPLLRAFDGFVAQQSGYIQPSRRERA